jgi:transposase
MFARIKKSGKYKYLQIVESRREDKKVRQRVIATVGRLDQLHEKGQVETLLRSLAKYSENVLLILSGKKDVSAEAKKIGPTLIFERLWKETGLAHIIGKLLAHRNFEFDVERAVFMTVLHRLMVSGSDRFCSRWQHDYAIDGAPGLELHHLYRAMGFLGQELSEQPDAIGFSPRCTKDVIEEELFAYRRHLFSGLDLVFFDTTSIYFEGTGGQSIGKKGFNKDHRPDLNQMVVGAVIDDKGTPICCEMWPGNTVDVKSLVPICSRMKQRFGIDSFCVVADRGMISADTIRKLEENGISYILGVRMRNLKDVRGNVLSRAGRYSQVYPESDSKKDPSPLKVKEVRDGDKRYIVCMNTRQARKDELTRHNIVEALEKKIKKGAKSLVGNKGYSRYLKMKKGSAVIDEEKIKAEAAFDGKWVLTTNTDLSPSNVALKYKELWQVERVFRDMKSMLDTRPVYHQRDENIRGHVFCSFLALVLRKELERRLELQGHHLEWSHIKQDLKALQEITIEENGKQLAIRSQAQGVCGTVFKAVGVAFPPTIREVAGDF